MIYTIPNEEMMTCDGQSVLELGQGKGQAGQMTGDGENQNYDDDEIKMVMTIKMKGRAGQITGDN